MPKTKIKKTLRNKIIYSEYLEAKNGERGSIESFMLKHEKKDKLTRAQIYNIINGMEE
jgi:Mor family transcriptional regulator